MLPVSRYEWLNALESKQQSADKDAREAQAKKSKKKKKKEQEAKEADRATLWQALTQLERSSREQLENLYWEEVYCLSASHAMEPVRSSEMREGGREDCEWENTARVNVGSPIVCV